MNVHIKRLLLGIGTIIVLYFPLRIFMDENRASIVSALIGFFIAIALGPVIFKNEKCN